VQKNTGIEGLAEAFNEIKSFLAKRMKEVLLIVEQEEQKQQLHQDESRLSEEKQQMLHKVHDKGTILKNKKVLIVDDDIRNTFALTTVLEENNLEVFVGTNGKEALALLDEQPNIDIVLMDIMMPEMDGYETMQKIREQPQYQIVSEKLLSLMRVWLYQ